MIQPLRPLMDEGETGVLLIYFRSFQTHAKFYRFIILFYKIITFGECKTKCIMKV